MKNIVIQEGGVNKTLNGIKKIQTAKSGSTDDIYWIPESEAKLGEKTIKKNGTYKAEDDNLYGYSKVTVKGIGKATGVKPGSGTPPSQGGNGNDNEYSVEKDDDGEGGGTGELVEKVLPSSIKITTLPTKTTYQNGETIDTTGMVVTGYKNDGTVWSEDPNYPNGVIPLSEITIDPTEATVEVADEYSDGNGVNAKKIVYTEDGWAEAGGSTVRPAWCYPHKLGEYEGSPCTLGGGSSSATLLVTLYNDELFASKIEGDNAFVDLFKYGALYDKEGWIARASTTGRAGDGVFARVSWGEYMSDVPVSTSNPIDAGEMHQVGGNQEITVKWNRIEDEQELTDTFNITVSQ